MPVIPGDNDHAMKAALAKEGAPDSSSNKDQQSKKEATIQDHRANPGPVMTSAEHLGQPASKEELRKRAEELNKNT